ncbi:MAG: hypothetical protein CML23_07615 [Rhizobiaceae bacterium]|nr:hypothetical protein [Rhizobiaceae bacterium]|tara:strand:+ start:350 stop:697 length:348 start_codon:yes stop_codon:yes gene_type:complete
MAALSNDEFDRANFSQTLENCLCRCKSLLNAFIRKKRVVTAHDHNGVMVFDGRWKSCFCESAGLMEVYDQEADPHEFHNLVQHGIDPELKADILGRHLRKWLSTSDAGPVRAGPS